MDHKNGHSIYRTHEQNSTQMTVFLTKTIYAERIELSHCHTGTFADAPPSGGRVGNDTKRSFKIFTK
jgi:hypothetical protein